jgi:spore coat protein A
MRTTLASALSAVAVAVLGSVGSAQIHDVYVYSFDFSVNPPGQPVVDAVITVGETVRWIWVEGNHTTTAVAGIPEQWDATLGSGNPSFVHTFTNLGTFWYYCQPHGFDNGDQTAGGMSGTVTVLPAGAGACCMPNGTCSVTSPASCLAQGGTYQGEGTTCSPNPCGNQPITIDLPALRDNILYENATGSLSNGAGRYLYVGNQTSGLKRRSVIQFDLGAIPPGALIQSASLRLYCNQSLGAPFAVSLHRLLANWGEGTSDANGDESAGTAAAAGDATWMHRFFNTTPWAVPGGDFAAAASATLSIGTGGVFTTWSGAGLAADVQAWVDSPGSNSGWILRGDEASSADTKRFDSREGHTQGNLPLLTVTYQPTAPTGACCLPSGSCTELSASQCSAQGGSYAGDGSHCASVACPVPLTPFVDPLPLPAVAQPVTGQPGGAAHYEIYAREFLQQLHRDLPPTLVWGYAGSYPGPTIEARRGQPVTVTWFNDLRELGTGQLRSTHALDVDTCLHGPDQTGVVPVTVTHLHGGHVPEDSDGYPESSFAPGQQSPLYTYPNAQSAATLWYHDHALGLTRLNVYMGLAGFYLLRDDAEDALDLPRGEFEIPLAIQDRSFGPDGSLSYPASWHDHFFGDFVLVNGIVWPYHEVKQGKYRFRVLNGSNSRVYRLSLSNGAGFVQIGTDTGLMSAPVALDELTLSPGERADIVIDFAPYPAGTEIVLENDAPAPFPGTPGVGVLPDVMKFVVLGQPGDTDPLPAALVPVPPIDPASALLQRDLELKKMPDMQCPSHMDGMWMIDGLMWDDITELPRLGTTEIWAWFNSSNVTHPMHMHLVAFQVLDRQDFDVVTGQPTGPRVPPAPNEVGWKDTVQAPPGKITRVITRFEDYAGLFPYHCHVLEHEDNEMMRQFRVIVDTDGDGIPDAQDNCPSIANPEQQDCDADQVGDACEIAGGAPDCNHNGVPDSCDLAGGTSQDTNLNGVPDECETGPGFPFCSGDGSGPVACPCNNSGGPGRGCANSQNAAGAELAASGTTLPDTLAMTSSGELSGANSILLQGDVDLASPVFFGDGLRCIGGNLKRLYLLGASGDVAVFPPAGGLSISDQSAALGDPIAPGSTRSYQVYYRDPSTGFCPNPPGDNWNASNAQRVLW